MAFIVELVVTTCMLAQPSNCTEVRTYTGFSSAAQCERSALPSLPASWWATPPRRATHYSCEELPIEHDI